MSRRKRVTIKAANLYWETFCFREKPVTVDIRPTADLRRSGQREPKAAAVQLRLL
jgi:hypothetical protein